MWTSPKMLRSVVLLTALLGAVSGGAPPAADPAGAAATPAEVALPVVFPEHVVTEPDAYLCTAIALPDRPLKLVGIEPTSDQRIVHHMLLFGCEEPAQTKPVWNCKMAATCKGGGDVVLYGWGKNAPAAVLPKGSGYSVGPGTGIRSLVLQMHYLSGRPANDSSGIRLHLSAHAVPYSAGMAAFAAAFVIPPRKPSTLVPNSCCYSGWEPLHGFATRVHTHALGREVYLERERPGSGVQPERVVGLDPQQPQGFYPVKPEATFLPGDSLSMACNFDSSNMDHAVSAGHSSSDEMCNLYMMLYSHLPYFLWCLDGYAAVSVSGPGGLPKAAQLQPEAALWRPPAKVPVKGGEPYPMGQVSGVTSQGDGTLWVFHRGQRTWNVGGSVSDAGGGDASEPLAGPVVLQVDEDSGKVLRSWGAGIFVLPHMITLDYDGNVWVTDVGLHQAIKFSPEGKQLLALGIRMQQGFVPELFCKPTQVAPSRDGGVFVADGYCNSRVAEFDANGTWVRDYRVPNGEGPPMFVPHSVAYEECSRTVYVADRERSKVHAFERGTGTYLGKWDFHNSYGNPYSLLVGPYGTVLVLTWHPRTQQTHVVALEQEVGQVLRAYEVAGGMEAPHDLALLPAPLELTGSGERLLSVVISETREGDNLHKFVLAEPVGAGGESEEEEDAALAAAKAAAAAHFGGSTHAHGGQQQHQTHQTQQDVEREQQGEGTDDATAAGGEDTPTAHVGHAMVKPVDGDQQSKPAAKPNAGGDAAPSKQQKAKDDEEDIDEKGTQGGSAGQAEEQQAGLEGGGSGGTAAHEDAAHVGHSLVKPVEDGGEDGMEQQRKAEEAAAAEEQRQERDKQEEQQEGDEDMPPPLKQQEKEGQKNTSTAGDAAADKQRGGQPSKQQRDEASGSADADFLPDEDEDLEAQQQQHQQQQQQEDGAGQEAGHAGSHAAGAAAAQRGHEESHHAIGHVATQPWVLGVVFVGAALAAWSRLQHWRHHGGAGYHAPPGNGHAAPPGSPAAAAPAAAEPAGMHRHHLVDGRAVGGRSGEQPPPSEDV